MGLIKWILYFIISLAVVFIVDFFLRKKDKLRSKILIIFIKLILSLIFAFLPLGGPLFLRPIQGVMVALYIVLFADAIVDILFIFIKKNKFIFVKVISLSLSLALFLYGTININNTKVNEHTFSSDKVSHDYSFVFVSDVHVGDSSLESSRAKLVETIKNMDIDFVVLGGDITDDYTSKEEMEEFYSYFKDFTIPVYFIYGNHDTQDNETFHASNSYTIEELENAQRENGIIVLNDDVVIFDELELIGRVDKSINKDRQNEFVIDNSKYTICLDHQPCDLKGESLLDVDLQVSGHTHAGQFAPLSILYDLFITPAYGEYEYEDTTLIVSSGAFGWRVPYRSDHNSEIELIHIKSN